MLRSEFLKSIVAAACFPVAVVKALLPGRKDKLSEEGKPKWRKYACAYDPHANDERDRFSFYIDGVKQERGAMTGVYFEFNGWRECESENSFNLS